MGHNGRPQRGLALFLGGGLLVLLLVLAGCGRLRFAPSAAQQQIAWATHQTARAVDAGGAEAASPATEQLVDGTATALAYTGMPAAPEIVDYATTSGQAAADAAARPTAADVVTEVGQHVEGGLSLLEGLLAVAGLGGVAIGGKKAVDWVSLARQKNTALQEVVLGNELLLQQLGKHADGQIIIKQFKDAQGDVQSGPTERIVRDIRTTREPS